MVAHFTTGTTFFDSDYNNRHPAKIITAVVYVHFEKGTHRAIQKFLDPAQLNRHRHGK